MRWATVARLVGALLVVYGVAMATSIGWALWFGEQGTALAFLGASGLTVVTGLGLRRAGRTAASGKDVSRREAFVVVSAAWMLAGLLGAVPFLLDGAMSSPIDALFESVSGLTTTGASVMTDIESHSKGLLWWRALTHWLGGMGIIVLFLAVFPEIGVGTKQLYAGEAPGPITEGLRPKIQQTSVALYRIYLGLTLVAALAYWACGMSFYEAANHAISTLGTGGFSTKNASAAGFDSGALEWLITLFMLVAGVNFGLYHSVLRGQGRKVLRDPELRLYAAVIVVASGLIVLDLWRHATVPLAEAPRQAAFQVAAVVTTTGFTSADWNQWPPFSRVLLLLLMFGGGMAGSTAGGLKLSRVLILAKSVRAELARVLRPRQVVSLKLGDTPVPEAVVRATLVLFFLSMGIVAIGSLLLSAMDLSPLTAVSASVSCLFNIGPGLEAVGASESYAAIPPVGKLYLSATMLLGRLEFYTALVLVQPAFWRR